MGFLSKTLGRSKEGQIRKEDDMTNYIGEFLSNQKLVKYEITDDKNWVVNVEGHLHLDQPDLDNNGELFFKIGTLTGNLYFHGTHLNPSVIPSDLKGQIIFVQDEEELTKNRAQKGNGEEDEDLGMGLISTKVKTQTEIVSNLKKAIADTLLSQYKDDIDIQEILDTVKKEWEDKDKFQLRIDFPQRKTKDYNSEKANIQCNIYVHDDDYNVPKDKRNPLKFNAIQTAYYLMFVLKKDGLIVDDVTKADWELVKNIYSKLAKRVEKTYITDKKTGKEIEYTQGVKKNLFTISSIRSYMSEIRDIIHDRISYRSIANEFAIEGYKGKPFGVARATDEMRAEIRKTFGLD